MRPPRKRRPPRWGRVILIVALVLCAITFSRSSALTPATVPVPPQVTPNPSAPVSDPFRTPEPLARAATMRETVIQGKTFGYCANGSVDNPALEVTRVIFVMHGNDRQACSTATAALAAGTPEQRATTLVVTPRFPIREDRVNPERQWYWTFYSWSQGDAAANEGTELSSFQVLDELIDRVRHLEIVVAGFSGGGQFVARYAAGTPHEALRYVITNPSSYLYFTPERPGTPPEVLQACPTYDNYRYGVNNLNDYMAQAGTLNLARRFSERRVVFLLGDADNDPRSSSMDRTCGALAQGANRFERGQRYWEYLPTVFGPSIRQRHALHVVPKAGHSVHAMFQDPAAKQALYG